jgi:predicted permease
MEELMFRGFLLLVISRSAGWQIAILLTSLAFGLFHLQGTGINIVGLRMVASTGTYRLVFALSYVVTRSLWTAISVHATSNILLHAILGLDGANQSIFVTVFTGNGQINGDWGLEALVLGAIATSCFLYLLVVYKFKKQTEGRWAITTGTRPVYVRFDD